ncbi:hypothetical protein [Xenorhabdus szentirmaii]|uniref:Lipoprotein n=1 Tax=Xenorhabdus szentirmaii TaxID=290112 RepID=A0AAW3YS93_9GAMM|nr:MULTISPECIES: hypothetical protein [Xenorhabdus]MBD2782788.1 hypothetical protein [Xenorhabdus sp. 38]MBD2800471.1 hypothetical protein [Xenorhabdus sp. M]MBD2806942.1 hypothetical protein [Xenorhabdus sp. ZM]PHM34844.1 hypothetical protein Xsze_01286 [Xenorhabdus szentirmaii DSM 16338]
MLFILFTSSCSSLSVSVYPEENYLPDATVGKEYHVSILIEGGSVYSKTPIIIEPPDSGIKWSPHKSKFMLHGKEEISEDYNHLIISGKPSKVGEIYITVGGGVSGTMFTGGGKFNKIYTIKVKE